MPIPNDFMCVSSAFHRLCNQVIALQICALFDGSRAAAEQLYATRLVADVHCGSATCLPAHPAHYCFAHEKNRPSCLRFLHSGYT